MEIEIKKNKKEQEENEQKTTVGVVSVKPNVYSKPAEENIEVNVSISPRMRRTSFQARLGKKMDTISRKLIDNQIRLTANPTNMLRVKVKRDERSQDLISRTISTAEIVPIILPQMKDIPMRRFIKENGDEVLVPSLYPTAETTYYELYSPLEIKLDEDDLLLRVIQDPHSPEPYVLCLQITDILGTLGYASFRYHKFWATIYDENLPKEVITFIKNARNQRELLGW